jgi:ureidoglycolate dehydrogenase (NAD+)
MVDGRELAQRKILLDDLERFCAQAMIAAGLRSDDARTSAKILTTNDSWGVHTHGTRQIRGLMKNVADGRIDTRAAPEVVKEGVAWVLVSGHHAMPMVTSHRAMELAMSKAKGAGVGFAGVFDSSHFAAAGYYATMALSQDMIGMAMTNVDPWITVPGGKGPVLGTNPIAYAIPAGEERPVFFDVATSTVAVTKILAAKALGKEIPEGWLVDDQGLPTTDPSRFPEEGALLPMAGHKGYGLALFVEVLSAVLTGAAMMKEVNVWIHDVPDPARQGHAFIAIDVPAILQIDRFKSRMDWMIREIRNSPKAKGSDRIYLPGEMEWERRETALENGVQLPDYVTVNLYGLAEDCGLVDELVPLFR